MSDFCHRKPQIDYPCEWEYRLIGESRRLMQTAARDVVGEHEHSLAASHDSRTGRYCSLQLVVTVPDEETRVSIFHSLREHDDILMVL